MTATDGFGHNEDTMLFCHLCDWRRECRRGLEEMEFALRKHLAEAHGKPLLYRVEDESGKRTDIP